MYWADEPLGCAQRGIGVVLEIGVDLGLRDLGRDLRLGRGLEAQALQARVECIEMAAIAGLRSAAGSRRGSRRSAP